MSEQKPYDPMPTPCDLACASLYAAMGTNPSIQLHVHPDRIEQARHIVAETSAPWRTMPTVVADHTLVVNEWYLVSAIGSDPP